MIKRTFTVGDIHTVERNIFAGTDEKFVLARLNGGVILLDIEEEAASGLLGAEKVQRFKFRFVQPGEAEIQFACQKNGELLYEEIFPFDVVEKQCPGGWSGFAPLTEEDEKVFRETVNLKGMIYTPVVVSKQVVDGINYRFFCTTKSVTLNPEFGYAKVTIYAKQGEKPKLVNIIRH